MASEGIKSILASAGEWEHMFQLGSSIGPIRGYSNGYTWNGFEIPKFAYTQAKEVLGILQDQGDLEYEEDNHRIFHIKEIDYASDEEWARECGPDINGLYLVDDRGWAWSKA